MSEFQELQSRIVNFHNMWTDKYNHTARMLESAWDENAKLKAEIKTLKERSPVGAQKRDVRISEPSTSSTMKHQFGEFDRKILHRSNKFLKRYSIAPSASPFSDGDDEFWFKSDEHETIEQCCNSEPPSDWQELSSEILFRGDFFQLVTENNYGDGLAVKDVVSCKYRPKSKVTVVDILRHASRLAYDPITEITGKVGFLESIKVDKKARYPTLILDFECS